MSNWTDRIKLSSASRTEQQVGEWLADSYEGLHVAKYGVDLQRADIAPNERSKPK